MLMLPMTASPPGWPGRVWSSRVTSGSCRPSSATRRPRCPVAQRGCVHRSRAAGGPGFRHPAALPRCAAHAIPHALADRRVGDRALLRRQPVAHRPRRRDPRGFTARRGAPRCCSWTPPSFSVGGFPGRGSRLQPAARRSRRGDRVGARPRRPVGHWRGRDRWRRDRHAVRRPGAARRRVADGPVRPRVAWLGQHGATLPRQREGRHRRRPRRRDGCLTAGSGRRAATSQSRLLNVAISRARDQLIVLADSGSSPSGLRARYGHSTGTRAARAWSAAARGDPDRAVVTGRTGRPRAAPAQGPTTRRRRSSVRSPRVSAHGMARWSSSLRAALRRCAVRTSRGSPTEQICRRVAATDVRRGGRHRLLGFDGGAGRRHRHGADLARWEVAGMLPEGPSWLRAGSGAAHRDDRPACHRAAARGRSGS